MGKRRHLPGVLRGKGEWVVEVMPLWVASYPRQTIGMRLVDQSGRVVPVLLYPTSIPEKSFFGSSITPWLMRWNFNKQDSPKVIPWVQIGGGLLWTDHKFPIVGIAGNGLLAVSVASIPRGESSVINFTPQVDAGVDIFRRRNRSVNAAVKAVHISNASLGDSNPGLNVTVQFSVGYSWWK